MWEKKIDKKYNHAFQDLRIHILTCAFCKSTWECKKKLICFVKFSLFLTLKDLLYPLLSFNFENAMFLPWDIGWNSQLLSWNEVSLTMLLRTCEFTFGLANAKKKFILLAEFSLILTLEDLPYVMPTFKVENVGFLFFFFLWQRIFAFSLLPLAPHLNNPISEQCLLPN